MPSRMVARPSISTILWNRPTNSPEDPIILAPTVNTIAYAKGVLLVRIHTNRVDVSQGSRVSFNAKATLPSGADPREFTHASFTHIDTGDLASNGAPHLDATAAAARLPPFVRVALEVTQGSVARAIFFECSVELLLRTS